MFTVFFLTLTALGVANAEIPQPPKESAYAARGQLSYFMSESNYDENGDSESLFQDGSFSHLLTELQADYDFSDQVRLSAGLSTGWVDYANNLDSKSNYGLSEFTLGSQYWLGSNVLHLVPAVEFAHPGTRWDTAGSDALYTEGAMRLRMGSWLIYEFVEWSPFAYLGYEYRDESRAPLGLYQIGGHTRFGQMYVQAAFRGYISLADDGDIDNRALRDLYLNNVNTGSNRFYAINPALHELAVQPGYRFGDFIVYGELAATLAGESAAEGYTLAVGFGYQPGVRTESPVRNDGFDPTGDEYDDSLFRKVEVPKDKKIKTPKKTPNLDRLIRDTEKELDDVDKQ